MGARRLPEYANSARGNVMRRVLEMSSFSTAVWPLVPLTFLIGMTVGNASTHPHCRHHPTRRSVQNTSCHLQPQAKPADHRARRRHSDKWFTRNPCRAAIAFTRAPDCKLSATIRALFSSARGWAGQLESRSAQFWLFGAIEIQPKAQCQ